MSKININTVACRDGATEISNNTDNFFLSRGNWFVFLMCFSTLNSSMLLELLCHLQLLCDRIFLNAFLGNLVLSSVTSMF
jgi:hypothetical protein